MPQRIRAVLRQGWAAFVLGGLLIVGAAQADLPKEIRIAVPDLSAGAQPSGGGVVDVLRQQQLLEQAFSKDGIEVQWHFFKGAGPVINEALANGQVDFAYLGDLGAIVGKANGLDTRLLSATVRDTHLYLGVTPESGITTLQELKGKRVGLFRGTAVQLSFNAALASQGLKERDFQVINLDFNAANAALAAKQIDAVWGLSGLIALKLRGLAELPLSTDDLGGAGNIQSVLIGNGRFVDAYPEVTQRLLAEQQKAVSWLRDPANKETYIDLVTQLAGYPRELLAVDLENTNLSVMFDPHLDAAFIEQLQSSVDLAESLRLVRKGFVVKEWLVPALSITPQTVAQP